MHRPIVEPDESEAVLAEIPSVEKMQAVLSPAPDDVAEKRRLGEIEFLFEGLRNCVRTGRIEIQRVRLTVRNAQCFGGQIIDGNSVPAERLVIIEAVDCAQRIKPKNGGQRALIFDVGEAAERDRELVVGMTSGD